MTDRDKVRAWVKSLPGPLLVLLVLALFGMPPLLWVVGWQREDPLMMASALLLLLFNVRAIWRGETYE